LVVKAAARMKKLGPTPEKKHRDALYKSV